MEIWPAAAPFKFPGNQQTGVLVLHGFTSSPASVIDWGKGFAAAGWTVSGPRLTGHGTAWSDLNRTSWHAWETDVETAYQALATQVRQVFVAGLSMGGALACLLAQRHSEIAGLMLINHLMVIDNPLLPLAPLIRHLVPSVAAIANDVKDPTKTELAYPVTPTGGADEFRKLLKVVRPRLKDIHQPVLMFKSRADHVLPVRTAPWTMARLGSADKELIWLDNSYHVATIDFDLPIIIEKSLAFVRRLGG